VTPVVATDLDRTLIYSHRAIVAHGDEHRALTVVERHDGADASWMTAAAAERFAELHRHAVVVPTTTRTLEQLRRVELPGPPARYAIAANGGVLLVDGAIDRAWTRAVTRGLAPVATLAEIWDHAGRVCRPEWTIKLRNAEGLFCYAVLHRSRIPAGFVAETRQWAGERGWEVSLQGRKLYWVPRPLTKSAAVAEVSRRCGGGPVYAAGDSLLDADLLAAADAGIMARHGELAAAGWHADHVEVTSRAGVRAGEQIVRWLEQRCTG
jgi:hypothetical protein